MRSKRIANVQVHCRICILSKSTGYTVNSKNQIHRNYVQMHTHKHTHNHLIYSTKIHYSNLHNCFKCNNSVVEINTRRL